MKQATMSELPDSSRQYDGEDERGSLILVAQAATFGPV
jgi:hypothetical protein